MLRSMNMSHTAHVYRYIQTMQNIFINIECFPAAVLFRGALALKKIPSRRGDIEQVSHHGTFDIKDLAWIAATIGGVVRVTIQADAHKQILAIQDPRMLQDSLFGTGEVVAHLLFSWQKAVGSDAMFGHFDLMSPRRGVFSLMLLPDVTRLLYKGV